jgi:hypothetical protein
MAGITQPKRSCEVSTSIVTYFLYYNRYFDPLKMKFDPIKKEVYTDKGELVKKMNCPFKMKWDDLEAVNNSSRKCTKCDHFIVDTAYFSDDELLNMVRENPKTCLTIDLNQHNIKIIVNGILGT